MELASGTSSLPEPIRDGARIPNRRIRQSSGDDDAILVDTDVQSSSSEPVQFGRQVMRATAHREYFKGAIDDIILFNRALSGDEIRALIQNNSAL